MWFYPTLVPFVPAAAARTSFIADSYGGARQAFLEDAAALAAEVQSFAVGAPAAGLFVDTALIGERHAPNLLAVVCGVHGVEGYAGSACMNYLMRHYDAASVGPETAVLLVHALNPWGFANDSRTTEHNVDLNRNFVDFDAALPVNAVYARMHAMLCADFRPGVAGLVNEAKLFASFWQAGTRLTQEGLAAGQYDHSRGLFYGGRAPTANREILDDILGLHFRSAKQVRLIDIHTGPGRFGASALYSHRKPGDLRFAELNGWLDGKLRSTRSGTPFCPPAAGMLTSYVESRLDADCHALTLRFGVATPFRTLHALRLDNWVRRGRKRGVFRSAAEATEFEQRMRQSMRNVFVSSDPVWERSVLLRFCWAATRMLASLSAPPSVRC